MLKTVTLSFVCLAVLGGSIATSTADATVLKAKLGCPSIHKGINFYKHLTWKWQDELGIAHSKSTKAKIHPSACGYALWVARLWRKRAWGLRDYSYTLQRANRDFDHAAKFASSVFPSISSQRLWDRASVEGGHGSWYCNRYGSGACGWFQFMEGTFYGRSREAFLAARNRGFPIPQKYNSWYSVLGQNLTAAYMFSIGLECSGEGWAASC